MFLLSLLDQLENEMEIEADKLESERQQPPEEEQTQAPWGKLLSQSSQVSCFDVSLTILILCLSMHLVILYLTSMSCSNRGLQDKTC